MAKLPQSGTKNVVSSFYHLLRCRIRANKSPLLIKRPCGTQWSVFSNICPVHMVFWTKNGLNWPKFKLDASLKFSKINNTLAFYLHRYSSLIELSKSDWFRWQKSSYGQINSKWHQHVFFHHITLYCSSFIEQITSDRFRWQKSSYGQITSKWHQHGFFIVSLSTVILS